MTDLYDIIVFQSRGTVFYWFLHISFINMLKKVGKWCCHVTQTICARRVKFQRDQSIIRAHCLSLALIQYTELGYLQCCSTRNTTGKCWQKATVVLISIVIGLQNFHSSNSISFPWFYQQSGKEEQVHQFVSQQVPNKCVLVLCSNSTFLPSERCSCPLRQQKCLGCDMEITRQHWGCSFYCFWNLLGELKIPKGCNILSVLLVTYRTQRGRQGTYTKMS